MVGSIGARVKLRTTCVQMRDAHPCLLERADYHHGGMYLLFLIFIALMLDKYSSGTCSSKGRVKSSEII
jgi:hypothetical protein